MVENTAQAAGSAAEEPVMLVIGNMRSWHPEGRMVPQLDGFHFVGFDDVTAALLRAVAPDVVLSSLMGEDFDALDLGRRLHDLGYDGRYRAITCGLPDPHVVSMEVRAAAPDLDFDIFVLDDMQFGRN